MKDDCPFWNMTALITGASTGIGTGTTIAFAQQGVYVLIHFNANHARVEPDENSQETASRCFNNLQLSSKEIL